MNIGALLREGRWRAELSQRTAAYRAGVTQGTLSRWETGAVLPSFADVDRVLAVCGLQLEGRLVTLHEDLHVEFARRAALSVDQRCTERQVLGHLVYAQLSHVAGDVVVCGGLAALAHGLPIERLQGELLLPDDDAALERVLAALRLCHPEIVLDGQRYGVELTVALLRRHPVCDWWARGIWFTTRVLALGDVRPATTVLPVGEGRLVVQAAEALMPDAAVRADLLETWLAWRAAR